MKNLILPIAGKSSRFPNTRPKWMLNHPKTKRFMLSSSIEGLNLNDFDKIYIGYLKEHSDQYKFIDGLKKDFEQLNLLNKIIMVDLQEPTRSQSETVYQIIKKSNLSGYIFIKDCDNYYECNVDFSHNQICSSKLEDHVKINPNNKSYLEVDEKGFILNIVEKKIISDTFSVGGYGFKDSEKFVKYFEKLNTFVNSSECYVSNVIYEMLLNEEQFVSTPVKEYVDWGTLDDWLEYKSQYKTIFCDIDGTLITNTSGHFEPYYGQGQPMKNNIEQLKKLYEKGKTTIILTTSRPKNLESLTINELKKHNIPFDMLIMDLPHTQRVLINDYSTSNPYPSCHSINIFRNSDTLFLN